LFAVTFPFRPSFTLWNQTYGGADKGSSFFCHIDQRWGYALAGSADFGAGKSDLVD